MAVDEPPPLSRDSPVEADYENSAGAVLMQLLRDQMDEERARKHSLEQRGITVITTSGALVTLVLALSAVVPAAAGKAIPVAARVPLLVALVLFATAALMGLATNWPFGLVAIKAGSMGPLLERSRWVGDKSAAARSVALMLLDQIVTAESANGIKANLLIGAIAAEACAVGAIVVTVLVRILFQ
jgi:hypothetical protein